MFRNNRLFVCFMLVFALLAQPLAAMAQDKTLKSGGANPSAGQNGAGVEINKVRLAGDDVAEVSWAVALPSGIEATGFEVRVDAELSNGLAQTDSKSFGGNARFGSFKFNLPAASNGGPKPGGGNSGTIGPANIGGKSGNNNSGNTGNNNANLNQAVCQQRCFNTTKTGIDKCIADCLKGINSGNKNSGPKTVEAKSADKTPRKFGEGNISGGNNNGGNNTGSNSGGLKPNPNPGTPPLPRPTPPTQKPEAVRITSLRAFITAKFATGDDLAAFREFIQPTNKTTGELTPKGGRGSSLQVKKLIHLNEVTRLAAECPAGQNCFDVIAELRGVDANGQFKVSLEAIYSNGQRRTNSRTAGNLLRPVRLSVDKIAGATVSNVLVNINGGGNREQFIKTDTAGVGILSPVGQIKK